MLTEPFWYWLLALAAAVLFCAPWALFKWEQRQDERDRETWDSLWR